jgi:hypothetical protein
MIPPVEKPIFDDLWFPIEVPKRLKPQLLVVIDTEEDFDWSKPFSRDERRVASARAQPLAHRLFERYGIKPIYLVDHPIVSQRESIEPLRDLFQSGLCDIGTQLHPWVNPPYDEVVNNRNSFAGNLPPALEARKLEVLTAATEEAFGIRPVVYKAGRNGLGPKTFETLNRLGYSIDMSSLPGSDLTPIHGPDYRNIRPMTYWIGQPGQLFEIPLTRGYVGMLSSFGPKLERLLDSRLSHTFFVPAMISRLALLNRIELTPEGIPPWEHRALVRRMVERRARIFTLCYHSPSLVPGNTPYVRSTRDLRAFLDSIEQFFDFFFGTLGGEATTPLALRERIYGLH